MPVVEQQGGLGMGDAPDQMSSPDAAGHPGLAGEQAQQLQANGLAGLFLSRTDIEIRSAGQIVKAIGMHNPEHENSGLMVRADQKLAHEFGHGIEVGRGRLLRDLGRWGASRIG